MHDPEDMRDRKATARKAGPEAEAPAGQPGQPSDSPGDRAFDMWLQRSLHRMFDDVASEPIPPELLRLIEEDRTRRGG